MKRHVMRTLFFRSFVQRARGLIGREHLLASRAAVIAPCRAIHTFGMKTVIDVVFLDSNAVVVDIAPSIPPFRFCRSSAPGAAMALEFASGEAARRGLSRGDIVIFHQ